MDTNTLLLIGGGVVVVFVALGIIGNVLNWAGGLLRGLWSLAVAVAAIAGVYWFFFVR